MSIIFITLVGLALRLILSNQSFWLDEGASLMFAKLPITTLFESIKTDFHPPLFYAFLHFWLPVGDKSEWLLRLPFIILATATIPAIYFLCKEIFGKKSIVPLLSALFLALNPLHIYYSQDLRMYSLVTLLVVLSWCFLVKKNYILVSVFNLLSFFTFYGAVFNIISQAVFLFFGKSKRSLVDILTISIFSVTGFMIWLPIFLAQLNNGQYLKNALPGWQILSGTLTTKSLLLIPLKFILGRISFEPQKLYLLAGGLITLIFFFIIAKSIKNLHGRLFWVALCAPLLIAALLSLKTPVLGYWRFIFVLPFFLTLLAVGIETLPKIILAGTTIWVCGVFIFANIYFWTNPRFQREDWRGLSQFLAGKNALVLLPFPYQFAPLDFYSTGFKVFPMQDSSYQQLPYFQVLMEEKMQDREVAYYLDYLADITDPERKILNSLNKYSLKQTGVYNFNNLGQVYEFQPL